MIHFRLLAFIIFIATQSSHLYAQFDDPMLCFHTNLLQKEEFKTCTDLTTEERTKTVASLTKKIQSCTDTYDFNPYQLDDLPTLWLDASDTNSVTISGGQVTAWNDISGNNFQATQTDPTRQAVYSDDNGFPMIEFNGTKFMSIPHDTALCISTTEGYQLFVVAKIFDDHSSNDFRTGIIHKAYNNQGADWGLRATSTGAGAPAYSGALYNSSGVVLKGEMPDGSIGFYDYSDQRSLLGAWYDPSTGYTRADGGGGKQYTNNYTMTLNYRGTEVTLGNRHGNTLNVHLGIHEAIFFPKLLTPEDKLKVEAYLARKWNLPLEDHLYSSDDPYNGNIALGATVTQSSDAMPSTTADKAVDQNKNGELSCGTVSMTNSEAEAWWEVDLGEIAPVTRMNIWNRTDGAEVDLINYYVLTSETPFSTKDLGTSIAQAGAYAQLQAQQAGRPSYIPINRNARYLRIQLVGTGALSLAEVEVIGHLSDTDRDGISNDDEQLLGTNPENSDTDGDGIDDLTEVGADINHPLDSENDGYIDALDSSIMDTDGDGTMDQTDADNSNPCIPDNTFSLCDQDGDGLTNQEEINGSSDPADACSPNPNALGCATPAQPGGFYFEWANFAPTDFGEKSITFDNTDLRDIGRAPAIGIHPRVYFTPSDVPDIINRMENTTSGQAVMRQIHAYTTLLHRGYYGGTYNHNSSYGTDPSGNRYIDNAGLWDSHSYYYNLINRVPDPLAGANNTRREILAGVLTIEAFDCMVNAGKTDPDTGLSYDERALMLAKAMAYWAETERNNPSLNLGNRMIIGGQHYALAYDMNYNNMTPAQRDLAREVISKIVSPKVLYGTDVLPSATTSNWSTLNSFELIINLSIEGEQGYNPQITEDFCKVFRNFITYAWYESGAPYEGLGKNYQFVATMVPMAMRGYSLLGHPHVKSYGQQFLPAISQPNGFGFVGTDAWGGTGTDAERGGYKFNPMDAIGVKWVLPDDPAVDLVWRNYIEQSTRVSTTGYVYQDIVPRGYFNGLLVAAAYAEDYTPGDYNTQSEAIYEPNDLSFIGPVRGVVTMRSSGSTDAMMSHFHCRQNLGGHTYGDRNSFTLSSHERIWVRYSYGNEIPETAGHSCILVNDEGLAMDGRNAQVPGRIMGFQENGSDAQVCGDATYAYSWEWDSAPFIPGVTGPVAIPAGWSEVTETPNDFQYQPQPESYFNTSHYLRPFWNGPEDMVTGRIKTPNVPMEKVYRTVAMARGDNPFLLVVDDVKKDAQVHNYKWLAQLPPDLSIESTDVNLDPTDYRMDITLQEASGTRKMLVRVLENKGYNAANPPGYLDQFTNFRGNVCDRLVIEGDAVSPDFKVLLYPYDTGDPLPVTSFDAVSGDWTVNIGATIYAIELTDDNGKTLVDINEVLLPLELLSFTGTAEIRSNKLSWKTADEVNTAYFDIEKSANGFNFKSIGTKQAQANANGNGFYTFDDFDLTPASYYRLKVLDQNGDSKYSDVVFIERELRSVRGIQSIFPNPTEHSIEVLAIASPDAQIQLDVIDILGRTLKTLTLITNSAGVINQKIDISTLPSGTYFLKVIDGKRANTASFIKVD